MLSYDMTARGGEPLYGYLYRCIRHDIAHGFVSAGDKLPSKRALAKHLGVSLATVEAAYRQLVAEGYVAARERSGYYVCELAPAAKIGEVSAGKIARKSVGNVSGEKDPSAKEPGKESLAGKGPGGKGLIEGRNPVGSAMENGRVFDGSLGFSAESASERLPGFGETPAAPSIADFTRGDAATKMFPYSAWAKTVRGVLSAETSKSLARAAMAAGSPELRAAIADYLREYRGMRVLPDQIVIGAGSQVLYQLVVQLLGRDAAYAVEAPGYPLLPRMYSALGAHVQPIGLDGQGIRVDALGKTCARVAHVMPAHQFPTGVAMSASRRRELLNWTRRAPDRYIIEDDYDSEFRMAGRPIAPLFGIDAAGRVLYLNSFAKSLGDAFRVAYLVLPENLVEKFSDELGFYSNTVSPLDQLALASFIKDGHYERHVSRLRTHARRAQDALVGALQHGSLGEKTRFEGLNGGLHFVLRIDDPRSEAGLAQLAFDQGVALSPMGDFSIGGARGQMPGFVLRYDGSDEETAIEAAHALELAWG